MTQAATPLSQQSARVAFPADQTWRSTDLIEIDRAERNAQECDLVSRLLVDDPAAWRFFTERYSRVAMSCIRRVLSRFSSVTSEHDVDEVYARFCFDLLKHDRKKLRCFDPQKGGRLSTWIGMLATNATYDYLRRVKRDRVCDPLPESDCLKADTQSPYEQAFWNERAEQTARVMQELSERDREFVELYFARGLDAEAVATKMGISIKTVYTKRHKISARLDRLLTDQDM